MHRQGSAPYLTGTTLDEYKGYFQAEEIIDSAKTVLEVGVGLGVATRELHVAGKIVSCLDISHKALEHVSDVATTYHIDQIDTLPSNSFDVITHFLVAQHVDNDMLKLHITHCLRSLKPSGLLLLQFARGREETTDFEQTKVQRGGVLRYYKSVEMLIQECGGEVEKVLPKMPLKNGMAWYFLRCRRKKAPAKVTVFTSAYNSAQYLPQAIASVRNQTYTDFDYLLVNDGSKDTSLKIMEKAATLDSRIKVVDLPKQPTIGHVLNKSISLCDSELWSWCPADDIWVPKLLERKLEVHQQFPNAVLYNAYTIIDGQGKQTGQSRVKDLTPQEFREEVWRTSPIGFTGICIPTYIFKELGLLFPEHLQFSEDFYWMIKATILGIDFIGLKDRLHMKRKHSDSMTAKNINAIWAQVSVIRAELRKLL